MLQGHSIGYTHSRVQASLLHLISNGGRTFQAHVGGLIGMKCSSQQVLSGKIRKMTPQYTVKHKTQKHIGRHTLLPHCPSPYLRLCTLQAVAYLGPQLFNTTFRVTLPAFTVLRKTASFYRIIGSAGKKIKKIGGKKEDFSY